MIRTVRDCFAIFGSFLWALMQTLWARCRMARIKKPIITVFGGKGASQENEYAHIAYDLSGALVERGFAILTGGGPGIMQAANCGAVDYAVKHSIKGCVSFGVRVPGIDEGFKSPCAYGIAQVSYFFVRKWLLINYSRALIVFPGGIGTLDEFFQVLNLIKTKKMKRLPVILVGAHYWKPLIDWYFNYGIASGFIKKEMHDLFTVVDDVPSILRLI